MEWQIYEKIIALLTVNIPLQYNAMERRYTNQRGRINGGINPGFLFLKSINQTSLWDIPSKGNNVISV